MSNNKGKEQLIAYCGLNCADCHGYTGIVPDLARDLRKELRQIHYDKFAAFISTYSFGKDFKDYEKCYKTLGAMVKFRCKKGCRNGGGSPFCAIRKCVVHKQLDGCWECGDFETCKKLQFLQPVHGDAHIQNLQMIKRKGKEELINGKSKWYSKIKEQKRK